MALRMSLNDVLAQHELEREDLDFKCPQKVRDRIAEELIDEWNLVGRALNVSRPKLRAIHRDIHHPGHEDKAVDMLDAWAEEYGERATCLKLAEALNRRKKRNIIEILCSEVNHMRPGSQVTDHEDYKPLAKQQLKVLRNSGKPYLENSM